MTGYEWVPIEAKCLRVCVQDHETTGQRTENGLCECEMGARWSHYQEKCIPLDCSELAYSEGPSADYTECVCQTNFYWDPAQYVCMIDCANLAYNTLGTGTQVSFYQCGCQSDTKWNLDTLKCEWECDKIANSTGTKLNGGLSCRCNNGFTWNEAGMCLADCDSAVPGQTGNFDYSKNHC